MPSPSSPSPPEDQDSPLRYEYLHTVSPALECAICRQPLQDPIQTTPCDHLFCRPCLSRALSLHPTCPIDRTLLPGGIEQSCRTAPRVVRELLEELEVKCGECGVWEGKRGEWEGHWRRGCGRREQEGEAVTEEGEGEQQEEEEEQRCEKCDEIFTCSPSEHSSICPSPLPCRYCSRPLPSSQHPSHLLLSCPSVPIPCSHAPFGCPFVLPRSLLVSDHLDSGECAYEPLKEGLGRARERWEEAEGEREELRARVGRLEGLVEGLVQELRGVRGALGEYLPPSSATASSTAGVEPPSLPAAVQGLTSSQSSLSTSLTSLAHSHTSHLSTTQHLADDLATLRLAVGGVRMQMGGVLMELLRGVAGGYSGGMGAGGGYGRRPGMRPIRTPSSEGDELLGSTSPGMGVGVGDGSSGSGSDDEAHLPYPHSHSYPHSYPYSGIHPQFLPPPRAGGGGFGLALPLPLPPGMRPVVPSSSSSAGSHPAAMAGELGGGGGAAESVMWSGGGRVGGVGGGGGNARGGVKL